MHRFHYAPLFFLIVIASCGYIDLSYQDTEHINLSYKQYVEKVGVGTIDPVGALEVSCYFHPAGDSYDDWWMITIERDDYEALLAQMTEKMLDPAYASYDSQRIGPVRKKIIDDPGIPNHWPDPGCTHPTWWKLPKQNQSLQCTRWELQVDNTVYDGRSKGWFWLYDADTSSLWIWHWNHQHFDLGWNMNIETTSEKK